MDKEELQQRSRTFAVQIRHLCERLMQKPTGRQAANQLLDAATSTAANYRSACRGRSRAEFIAKLGVVVEECDESVHWLEYIEESGLMPAGEIADHLDEAKQLRAIFAASYGTARRNHRMGNS